MTIPTVQHAMHANARIFWVTWGLLSRTAPMTNFISTPPSKMAPIFNWKVPWKK